MARAPTRRWVVGGGTLGTVGGAVVGGAAGRYMGRYVGRKQDDKARREEAERNPKQKP